MHFDEAGHKIISSNFLILFFTQDTVVGVEEGVGVIADSVVKVFTFASEAVDRCLKLTEGWGLTALIKAMKEVHIAMI